MSVSITARFWLRDQITLLGFLITFLIFTSELFAAGELSIRGWPFPTLPIDRPTYDFGDEPVVGRQICPPLTRLNLKTKSSEGIILRRAVEEYRGKELGSLWRLEVRTGIYWWNGSQVTSDDIAKNLKTNMGSYLAETYKGFFSIPPHEIKASDAQTVTIDWKVPPPFGPYVFNGMPLFRSVDSGVAGLKYECAGNYRPESIQPLILVPSSGYAFGSRLPKLKFLEESSTEKVDINFLFSSEPGVSTMAGCSAVWPSPYFSIISWNLASGRASRAELRKLMTGLIPRKEILASGVLLNSDVVSAPIPRSHPGYNSGATDMPFDAIKVSTSLDAMGFRRKKANATRTDPKGKPVRLTLINNRKTEGLVEKLISDSFSSVGLEVDFVESTEKLTVEPDGNFTPLETDYPRIDFLQLLHPKTPKVNGFWKVKDEEFLKQLELYALTISTERPDFSLLANIHKYLAENQVFSVIAHHRACIKTSDVLRVKSSDIATGEPDWFRDLLF